MASEHEWRDCFHPTTQQGGDGCHFFMRCHGIWPERCDLSERDHRESDAEKIERLMASEHNCDAVKLDAEIAVSRAQNDVSLIRALYKGCRQGRDDQRKEIARLQALLAELDAEVARLREAAQAYIDAYDAALKAPLQYAQAEEYCHAQRYNLRAALAARGGEVQG